VGLYLWLLLYSCMYAAMIFSYFLSSDIFMLWLSGRSDHRPWLWSLHTALCLLLLDIIIILSLLWGWYQKWELATVRLKGASTVAHKYFARLWHWFSWFFYLDTRHLFVTIKKELSYLKWFSALHREVLASFWLVVDKRKAFCFTKHTKQLFSS